MKQKNHEFLGVNKKFPVKCPECGSGELNTFYLSQGGNAFCESCGFFPIYGG